jgi:hypothetical protein
MGSCSKGLVVNLYFETDLHKYKMEPSARELFKMVVMYELRSSNSDELDKLRNIGKLIEEQETIISTQTDERRN